MLKFIKKFLKKESADEMRNRINNEIRDYNATGIASIKFIKGEWL